MKNSDAPFRSTIGDMVGEHIYVVGDDGQHRIIFISEETDETGQFVKATCVGVYANHHDMMHGADDLGIKQVFRWMRKEDFQ